MAHSSPFLFLDPTNAVSLGGTLFWDEGGSESLSALNPSATRKLVCNWVDRTSLIPALGGGYDPALGLYVAPLPHPVYPWLYPQEIKVEGIPGPDGMTADTIAGQPIAGYEWARLYVTYKRYNFDPTQVQLGDISIDYCNTVTAAPVGDGKTSIYQYVDESGNPQGDVSPADTPGLRVASATLTLTRNNCSTNASAMAFNLGGKVNKNAIFGAAPETLLFDGVSSDKQVSLGGANQWTNRIRLVWNSLGWNKLFNPNVTSSTVAAQYMKIRNKNGGAPLFDTADFSALTGFI